MIQDQRSLGIFSMLCRDHNRLRALAGAPPTALWRAFINPRMAPIILIRLAGSCERRWWSRGLARLVSLTNLVIFKVEVPSRAEIGPGLVLPHPMGIVIGSARIGADVTIFQNVTLGARNFDGAYDLSLRPVISDGVLIGTGAVVLGPVRVGPGARVGANSLLLDDVPAGGSALGVPAYVREHQLRVEEG